MMPYYWVSFISLTPKNEVEWQPATRTCGQSPDPGKVNRWSLGRSHLCVYFSIYFSKLNKTSQSFTLTGETIEIREADQIIFHEESVWKRKPASECICILDYDFLSSSSTVISHYFASQKFYIFIFLILPCFCLFVLMLVLCQSTQQNNKYPKPGGYQSVRTPFESWV